MAQSTLERLITHAEQMELAGLVARYRAGDGRRLDISLQNDGSTLYLLWGYADTQQVTVAFSVETPHTLRSPAATAIHAKLLHDDTELQMQSGIGLASETTPEGRLRKSYLHQYKRSVTAASPTFTLQTELIPQDAEREQLSLDFTLTPLTTQQRITQAQPVTDSGVTVTLEETLLTPSQVYATVRYAVPAEPTIAQWMALGHLVCDDVVHRALHSLSQDDGSEIFYANVDGIAPERIALHITQLMPHVPAAQRDDSQIQRGNWRLRLK